MEHADRAIACTLLRGLGLPDAPIEPVESYSHAVWMTAEHVVRCHVIGPVGRLEHEARVARRLPPEALYPEVVAVGRDSEHDWLVTRRVPGVPLSAAWPWMSERERRDAIHQAADALRAVHHAPATDLAPPCLQGGAPTLSRRALIERLLGAGLAGLSPLAEAVDDESTVMAHGDFNFNQVMWCDGRVTALLDLEMSHAECPDWDLPWFLGFCADPARCVPAHLEKASRPEDYRDAPRWLREAYPEMFGHPRQRDRLLLHRLTFRADELLADPTRVDQIVSASLEEVRVLEALLPD
jgi:aminoglycoside phosphotransferase (APT) family kinase protein